MYQHGCNGDTHTHSHREKERRPGAERCPPRYAAARTLHKSRLPVHIMCSIGAYTLFQCAVCSANNIKPQFNAQFIIGRAQRIFRATRAAADHCFDYLLHRTHRGDALRVISRQTKHHQQPGRERNTPLRRCCVKLQTTTSSSPSPPTPSNKCLVSFYS